MIEDIKRKIEIGDYRLTIHAFERCVERNISPNEPKMLYYQEKSWSPTGKARGSLETPKRGEHPVPEDQFTHG